MKQMRTTDHDRRGFLKKSMLVLATISSLGSMMLGATSAMAAVGEPEKEDLKFGFIKLTDMAPLAIAYEKVEINKRALSCGPAF